MGQSEIIQVLEKAKKPLSRKEIAIALQEDALKIEAIKVSMLLKKMLKYSEIKCIEIDRSQAIKHYNCKRRMRLYYV